MKIAIKIFFFLILTYNRQSLAQGSNKADILESKLAEPLADTSRVLLLEHIAKLTMYSKPVEAMQYAREGLTLAEKKGFLIGKSRCLNRIGAIQSFLGEHEKAVATLFEAIKTSEKIDDQKGIANAYINLGVVYGEQKDSERAIECYMKSYKIAEQIGDNGLIELSLSNLGAENEITGNLDTARFYTEKAFSLASEINSRNINILLLNLGNFERKKSRYDLALGYYRKSILASEKVNNERFLAQTYNVMAEVFKEKKSLDSSLYYARKSLELAERTHNLQIISDSGRLLSSLYEKSNPPLALSYFKVAQVANDSLFNQEKMDQIQKLTFQEKVLNEELNFAKKEYLSQQKISILSVVIGVFLLLSVILLLANRSKSITNKKLKTQKVLIENQKVELQLSLEKLKETQMQLMLQEKLASLGELTAGIAHEIQNPLNFVNNFSELSIELVEDLKKEILEREIPAKDDLIELMDDLELNQQKIAEHGKRASNIVVNMLEHSRGKTEMGTEVDINKLVDNYLRLSYHGMRAKDKTFNVSFEEILDPDLPLLTANGGDLGRVILNIINNAFYAANLRKQQSDREGIDFEPKIILKTRQYIAEKGKRKVEIHVIDNGVGMSKEVQNKVFQPFYTTKPTGEGTGLGLSLSNEIITKGHIGKILLESEEGKGSTFIIQLPA